MILIDRRAEFKTARTQLIGDLLKQDCSEKIIIRTHNQIERHVPKGSILNTKVIAQYLTFPPETLQLGKLKQKERFACQLLLNRLGFHGIVNKHSSNFKLHIFSLV